jgi:hypothetical protein
VRLLLAGGSLVLGVPTTSAAFYEANEKAIRQSYWDALTAQMPRKKADEEREVRFYEVLNPVKQTLDGLASRDGSEGPSVLNLTEAQWWPMTGDGLRLPGLRVPLAAVVGWWLDGGEPLPASGGSASGGWFVGGILPVD